ncbi:hypothetical protein PRIC1_002628 [Phytophthora ramorum]
MRQRRHVNGNSNAMASAAADASGWGSGRTVRADITSTLKRAGPTTAIVDIAAKPIAPITADKRENRSGTATARRPQSSSRDGCRDPLAGCRSKRRIQSARGANEKYNRPTEATGEATVDTVLKPNDDTSLPKIKSLVGLAAILPSTTGKTKGTNPLLKSSPPVLSIAASGTDVASQVQWAVKVASATPGSQLEPAQMRDLRRLLRDRYGEKRSVRQAFLTWDTNKDGCLCVDELRNMLTRLGFAQALGQKKVDTILQHVVAMPSASLHYDDFCRFVFGPPELNQSGPESSNSSSNLNKQATGDLRMDEEVVPVSDPDCVVSLLRAKYESRRVHQVFRDWDIDKSGGVTLAEIESNLRRQGLRIAKPQLMKLFDTYDLNHDGRLLYDEFMRLVYGPVHEQRYSYLAALRRKKQQEKQAHEGDPLDFLRRLRLSDQTTHTADDPGFRATLQRKLQTFAPRLNDAYAAFDDDHSGNLSYRELCHGLQQLGLNLTEREFLHLATRVDTDGSGEISFKEFCDVFGGDEASSRRRRSTPTRIGRDERIEDQEAPEPKAQAQDSSLRRRSAGTFNFAHLTRRAKVPTRCGRTPYASTKELVGGNQEDGSTPVRFTTEAQLYGSGSSSAPTAKVTTTLGQEEKQRRRVANVNRLQRLHAQMEHHEAQVRPLQDSYNVAQERRTRTLQRHQERYHQRIEEQRPRCALSPARKGIQISRPASTGPFE